MKTLILTLLSFLILVNVKGQTSKNKQDLAFLYQTIQQLPSYKDQVKTNPKLQYDPAKDLVIDDKATPFEVFTKLYELILPLRDNHLSFHSNPDSLLARTPVFEIPKSIIDSAKLVQNPSDSVAGTYYSGKYQMQLLKIGNDYTGVIESANRYFTQFLLKEITPNHFDLIGFAKNGQTYFVIRNIFFINQRLSGTPWRKYEKPDFMSLPPNTPVYDYKKLDNDITYLKLGSFGTSNESIAASVKFYSQLGEITTPHLVVDLRDNSGGGFKNSKKFLDLIKKFKGKVHLLVNSYSISNTEEFIIDLKDQPNVTLYGENTRGTLCYGNNRDTTLDLPSKRFNFYITDMKSRKQDLPFESFGIKPQVNLDTFAKDWIIQVAEKIKAK